MVDFRYQGAPPPVGDSGDVTSVTAGDGTVTIGGTGANPTVKVTAGQFDAAGAAATAQATAQAYADTGDAARLLKSTRQLKTGNYTAVIGDLVAADTTGGTFTVTIPAASGGKGRIVVKWVVGAVAPTIALSGSDHFNLTTGATSATPVLLNQGYQFESDGTSVWTVTADDLPLSQIDLRYAGITHAAQHEAGGSDVVPLQLISAPAVSTPAAPAAGNATLYVKSAVGREQLHQIPALFAPTPVADAPYAKSFNVTYVAASNFRQNGVGTNSSTGTFSFIAPTSGHGPLVQCASAASVNALAEITTSGGSGMSVLRGVSTDVYAGWYMRTRMLFPDASYNAAGASTGSRIFAGLASGSVTTALTTDHAGTAHCAGFSRCNVNGGATDTNWQFITNNGGTPTVTDTGMAFTIGHLYDFRLACAAGGTTLYWQVDDLTAATTQAGNSASTPPGATTALNAIIGLSTVDATARNFQTSWLWIESDKG